LLKKASLKDIEVIWKLVNKYAEKNLMLPRSLGELYENIRDFYVYIENGKVLGCGALHIVWEDCGEILSLAIDPSKKRKGIGSKILYVCEQEAREIGLSKIFTLTYIPEFFEKNGFVRIEKNMLPNKIWSMCIRCHKFPECDEVPLMKRLD